MRDVRKQDGFTPEEIKAANRRFYDLAARVYEEADGRRGEGLGRYLDRRLRVVRDPMALWLLVIRQQPQAAQRLAELIPENYRLQGETR